jgi:hypothetical protein
MRTVQMGKVQRIKTRSVHPVVSTSLRGPRAPAALYSPSSSPNRTTREGVF